MFFDAQSAKRIAAVTKRLERTPRNKPVGRRRNVTPQAISSAAYRTVKLTVSQQNWTASVTTAGTVFWYSTKHGSDSLKAEMTLSSDLLTVGSDGYYMATINCIVINTGVLAAEATPAVVLQENNSTASYASLCVVKPWFSAGAGSRSHYGTSTNMWKMDAGDKFRVGLQASGTGDQFFLSQCIIMITHMGTGED